MPDPATPVTTTQHADWDVDADVLQVVLVRVADLELAGRRPDRRLEGGSVAQVPPGQRVARSQAIDRALEADRPAVGPGAGPEVDDVVGRDDHLRLVLHDEDRVALVPQLAEQPVHPLDVVGVEAGGGLVEDVRDIGQRGPDVADHLDPLGLAARERSGRSIEAQVAEPDLDERAGQVAQGVEQRGHRWFVEVADPGGQVADLHRAGIGDADAVDPA